MSNWPKISGIISDLDGVVYRGDEPIASAVAAFRRWHEAGVPYAFVTNNSTKDAAAFAAKLCGMGVPADAADVVTTSAATVATVKDRWPAGTGVYVIGAAALRKAILEAGFVLADEDAKVVVAGLDREFAYRKLKTAQKAILSGAGFLGTNPDKMLPSETGYEPGAGSILAAIEACSGKAPTIVGKPQPTLIRMALARLGTAKSETLMIGDQVATDIAAGKAAGLPTLLVSTGVPESGPRSVEPDFVAEHLDELPLFTHEPLMNAR